jgi:hypothetical protein
MKIKKLNSDDYQIKIPKKSAFTIETPADQLRLHQLMCIAAGRGTGKGVILSSFLQGLKNQGCMDRIFMMSPTIASNKPIFGSLNINNEDEYHTPDKECIEDIIAKCNEEMDEWEDYEENLLLWKLINDEGVDINRIKPDLLLKALNNGWFESGLTLSKPVSKYGHKPILGLIIDDFQGSNLYTTNPKNPFLNLTLKGRHIARGLGISIFMCVQTYAGSGGVPRVIRQNLTSLLLGPQKNKEVIEQIADEVGGQIPHDTFMKVYEAATYNDDPTQVNHNFLLIDFFPKSPDKMFRRNLNTFIIPN